MPRIEVLGSMDLNGKFDIRNRVYSAEGLCPTIDSMTGGGREPMILDLENCGVERLGNVGDIKTQGRAVYDSNGVAPTLLSGMSHGNTVPYITEEKAIKINQATEQGFALCEIGGGHAT